MAMRKKGRSLNPAELETVINEICADDVSDNDIMIPELDELEENVTTENSDSDTEEILPVQSTSTTHTTSEVWTKNDIVPVIAPFTGNSGLKIEVQSDSEPFFWLKIFLDEELINLIRDETNRYAHQYLNSHTLSPQSRDKNFKEISTEEIWKYLGIIFMTGIDRRPEIEDYWSSKPFFHTPWYGKIMSIRRFQQISKFLHFADNKGKPEDCEDRLYKVRPVLELITKKFKEVYIPNKEISIDEGMMAWKGRLIFKVYMPDKPDKYGIKAYIVSEATSGYIWNFEIYCGKSRPIKTLVLDLLGPSLLGKGYHIYQDNFYNSVELCEVLLEKNTHVCGTFRLDRGAPKHLKTDSEKLKKGESTFVRKGQVLVQVWRDKRPVKLISTLHSAKIVASGKRNRKGEEINKPEIVMDYNKYMQGVDRVDQMLHYYPCCRKTVKWTKKLVFYLLQMAALNSFILLKKNTSIQKFKGKAYAFKDFLIDCIEAMTVTTISEKEADVDETDSQASTSSATTPPSLKRPPKKDSDARLQGGLKGHKMVHVPPTEKKKSGAMRKCRVCSSHGVRKETSVMCANCGVALCKFPCFGNYHTRKKY